ncbi:hypothetical protein BCE75_103286 [Isoptericola sp. CG 20/1183]|uniref:Uncharacterized protein n=1 Tax=Isoptericola halotolerans TaxID=300560 RepID=A0ABX5EH70_9MICO|nr:MULTISPECIES: hypothetical protein [Isoptericola]PRZ08357.1 hypothetical protein BCL65_103287 [Isoptericola halotolerans]PRZ09154.1 hypothetical protein BCE75_103286 [Isoptericola sp. CG 20/1183]
MTTERAVKDGVQGVDAPLTDEARRAERSVLVAAAVGLGVGVVVPMLWAVYPWVDLERSSWPLPFILFAPTLAALTGAFLARSFRRGPLFWLTIVLDVAILALSLLSFMWGGWPGATAAALLIVAGLVLLVGHPHRWRVVGLGLLTLCLSLAGTMGLVTHLLDGMWAFTLTASLLNLVAVAILVRRVVALRPRTTG